MLCYKYIWCFPSKLCPFLIYSHSLKPSNTFKPKRFLEFAKKGLEHIDLEKKKPPIIRRKDNMCETAPKFTFRLMKKP